MSEALPVPDYYVMWRVQFTLRFDEFGGGEVQKITATKTPPQMRGPKDKPPLVARRVSDVGGFKGARIEGAHRWEIVPEGAPAGSPLDRVTSGDGLTHRIEGIVPREFQWTQPGLREADKLSFTVRYVDFPFDPRCFRAVGVKFYLGTVRAEDWAKAVEGTTPMPNVLPETWTDEYGRERSNLRFEGWVDTWEMDWDTGAEPVTRLDCTGMTSLLMDQEAVPSLAIPADKPIDEAVAIYLTNYSQFAGLTVSYRPADAAKIPTLKESLQKVAVRSEIGPPVAKAGGAGSGGKLTVFDYLTDRLGTIGHVLVVDRHNLVIAPPRTLYSNDQGQGVRRPDDPYDGRSVGGFDYKFRGFIYGHNVESLKMKRVYRLKKKPANIEVRAFDTKSGQTLVVRVPENKEERTALSLPGDKSSEQSWRVIYVSGVNDRNTLKLIARAHFETTGRNELSVVVRTKDMASFGGGNTDPDILDMRVGDTFSFFVRSSPDQSSLTNIENSLLLHAKAMQYLTSLGYDADLAMVYAKLYADKGFQTEFKCRSIGVSGSVGDGVALDVTGVNYIEIRNDKPMKAAASNARNAPVAGKARNEPP